MKLAAMGRKRPIATDRGCLRSLEMPATLALSRCQENDKCSSLPPASRSQAFMARLNAHTRVSIWVYNHTRQYY